MSRGVGQNWLPQSASWSHRDEILTHPHINWTSRHLPTCTCGTGPSTPLSTTTARIMPTGTSVLSSPNFKCKKGRSDRTSIGGVDAETAHFQISGQLDSDPWICLRLSQQNSCDLWMFVSQVVWHCRCWLISVYFVVVFFWFQKSSHAVGHALLFEQ